MTLAERLALEGLLAWLRPRLAVEIGTFRGATLRRIAQWAQEAHSFDIDPRVLDPPPNVTFHRGDSSRLLPGFLQDCERDGRLVDFALVDGDHSEQGVRRDAEALLRSPAVRDTAILFHDTMNEAVRAGIESIDLGAYPKVLHVDLNFLQVPNDKWALGEWWLGLGLMLVGDPAARPASQPRPPSAADLPLPRAALWRLARRPRALKRRLEPGAVAAFHRLPEGVQRAVRRGGPWDRAHLEGEVEPESR